MENLHLCFCNNCETVLNDSNPQVNAMFYNVVPGKVPDLSEFNDEGAIYYNGCPNCHTDGYLQDEIPATALNEVGAVAVTSN